MSTASRRLPRVPEGAVRSEGGGRSIGSTRSRRTLLLAGAGAASAAVAAGVWWARTRPVAVPPSAAFAPAAPVQTDPFAGVPAGAAAAPNASAGPVAPDFTAPTVDGGKFTLSAQRGKPVLLLFTAGWCTSCIPEVQKLAKLHAEEGSKGLVIAALDVDPTERPADFLRLKKMAGGADHVWAMDSGQQATKAYGVRATDTKVLIDPAGRVAWGAVGATPLETLQEQIRKAFAAKP